MAYSMMNSRKKNTAVPRLAAATEVTRKVPMCPASSAAFVEIRSWYGRIVSQNGRLCSSPSS